METLQYVFPLHQAHPPAALAAAAQEPPLSPAPGTPLMPDSLGEAHVVVDLPDTPEIVVVDSEDEAMKGFRGYLEDQCDPKED